MTRYKYESCPKCRSLGRDNRGDNLAVYNDGSSHCFSCGWHVHPKHASLDSTSSISRVKVDHDSKVLPADFTREVPARAWQWLLQYGLPMSFWRDKVGWSEKDSRLVFCVPNLASVAFSQGRFISSGAGHSEPEGKPKSSRKWYNYGDSHASPHLCGDLGQNAKQIILVEDWISANKVSLVAPTISLFGTSIFDSCIRLLRHCHLPIVLWLDGDQRGTVERKAMQLSMLTGLPSRVVYSQLDPKLLSTETIKEMLK